MGLYDGKDPLSIQGSTAEVSILLDAPVLLVIDASAMARSAAAVVHGFQSLDARVKIAGVLVNRVGGEGHYRLIQSAVEDACGIPTLGYLSASDEWSLPERHLGLVPALEYGQHGERHIEQLAAALSKTCQLDAIWERAAAATALPSCVHTVFPQVPSPHRVTIAVAKDAAFHFYYPENLELLESAGAKIVYFSPLANEPVPEDADGLYIGGGFPETFAEPLSRRTVAGESVRQRIGAGMPTFVECGGFMYLTQSIRTVAGDSCDMLGVVPARVQMQKRLAAIGYRDVEGLSDGVLLAREERIRGHEFHYSTVAWQAPHRAAYHSQGGIGDSNEEGFVHKQIQGGYTHLYFPSNPACANRFVSACEQYRRIRTTS
jgi:cobyrinic acid a,c-diamide synthase